MKFQIPCETYYRLSKIVSYFQDDTQEEIKQKLNCIRLENIDGILIAVVTNVKIAVVEKIGITNQPNGVAHLIVDQQLIEQCKIEKAYNSLIEVILIKDAFIASAVTTFGYNYPGTACIFPDETPTDAWRTWAATEPIKKSVGAMCWDMDNMTILNESSLSGKITFPSFIDVNKPVVLRDSLNPNWVGLFMPKRPDDEPDTIPATLPEWWY